MTLFLKKSKTANHFILKCSLPIILTLLSNSSSIAQIVISGTITDTLNEPLPYVDVILKNNLDRETINWTTTDEQGHFNFDSKKEEEFILDISYIGFKTQHIPINSNTDSENIRIRLEESNEQLDAVTIESTKPTIEQKTDRFVFNVSQTTSGSGGTANDALKSTPGIKVGEDKLELAGKGEVKAMVNDKMIRLSGEDLITYLNSIPADNIESIEVISAPPSKYEAEGNSGLINIILKEANQDSWSNTIRTHYKQGSYPSFGFGDSFLYHKNKLELSASLDATKGYQQNINDLRIYFDEGPWREPIYMKNKLDNISGKINLDYNLTEKAIIGISYTGSFRNSNSSDHVHTQIFDHDKNEVGTLQSTGHTDNPINAQSVGAYYDQKLDTVGRKLSLSVDYFGYDNRQDRNSQTISDYPGQKDAKIRNTNNQYIDNYSASLDMDHPFEWAILSYGGKILLTKNRNRLSEAIQTPDNPETDFQKDHFKYEENVQALYADMVKNFGEKWTAKAGLRFENTETKGMSQKADDFKRSYAKWFPSAFINFEADKNNVLNLSYSRRIDRPQFWALNPARWYINSISYTEGNPFLQPAFTDNIELKHIFKNRLTSTLFVLKGNQSSDQIPMVDPDTKQQIYVFDNFYDYYSYGTTETFSYNPASWWKTTSQATLTYTNGKYKDGFEDLGQFQHGFNLDFYTNHNFFLNADKSLQLEATYTYSSPRKILMFDLRARSSLNLGVKTLFLDKKLQASLTVNDVFKGMQSKVTTYTNNIKQEYMNYFDLRNFNVSLTYKFGNTDLKSKEREAQNKTIQERTQ